MWGFHDGMGWWMVFGGLWMMAFWGVVIGLAVWAISRVAGGSSRGSSREESPLDIAKRRLAKGEITRQEVDDLKDALR